MSAVAKKMEEKFVADERCLPCNTVTGLFNTNYMFLISGKVEENSDRKIQLNNKIKVLDFFNHSPF